MSCEPGRFSGQTDRSRIVNGKGFSEKIPVCQPCPLNTYAEDIGSSVCQQCPKYHTTDMMGSSSIDDCIREFLTDPSSFLLCQFLTYMCFHISAQNLLLECGVSGSGDHVVVDCQTNRLHLFTYCSFDGGPKHTCMFMTVSPKHTCMFMTVPYVQEHKCVLARNTVYLPLKHSRFISYCNQPGCVTSWSPFLEDHY